MAQREDSGIIKGAFIERSAYIEILKQKIQPHFYFYNFSSVGTEQTLPAIK